MGLAQLASNRRFLQTAALLLLAGNAVQYARCFNASGATQQTTADGADLLHWGSRDDATA
jgi:hypothetical protein